MRGRWSERSTAGPRPASAFSTPSDKVRRFLDLSGLCRIRGRYKESRFWASKALSLARRTGPDSLRWDAEVFLGQAEKALGRRARAYARVSRAFWAYKRLNDAEGECFSAWVLGWILRERRDREGARRFFERSLALARYLQDRSHIAYALCGLAGVTRLSGDARRSLTLYRRALTLHRREKDRYGIAYALCGIGNGLAALGRRAEAVPFYRKSLALYRRIGDPHSIRLVREGLKRVKAAASGSSR